MDTKAALKSLYQIVAKQQEVISKIAQAQGLAPAAPAQAGGEDLTAKLQSVLYAANPGIQQLFIQAPEVATSADAGTKHVISFKYKAGKNSQAINKAVADAATQVLGGPDKFLLQGSGAF
jgi:hypothetical protein